jgi:hypothetical protein
MEMGGKASVQELGFDGALRQGLQSTLVLTHSRTVYRYRHQFTHPGHFTQPLAQSAQTLYCTV